jgi:hypothetical protein
MMIISKKYLSYLSISIFGIIGFFFTIWLFKNSRKRKDIIKKTAVEYWQ